MTAAYADAYAIHADPKYKTAFEEASKKYKGLADVIDEQKALFAESKTSKSTSGGVSLMDSVRTRISDNITSTDSTTLSNLLEVVIKNGLDGIDIPVDYLQQAIFGERLDIPDEYWQDIESKINEKLAEMNLDPIKLDVNTGSISKGAKVVEEGWKDAAAAVQSVGNALQQIEDPGAKVAGLIGEAIANIALGFAQATASDSKLGVFGWIAAIAGGLGTMLGTISAIKSATAGSYAEGGIIPGNNHNDGLIAAVSSGELILNRAQQNSIANQLQGGAFSNIQIVGVLEGENIVLAANRVNRRKGKGEYAYTKSR